MLHREGGSLGWHPMLVAGAVALLSACSGVRSAATRGLPGSAPAGRSAPTGRPASSTPTGPPAGACRGARPPSSYDHVVWIWMENHTRAAVLPESGGTFLASLAASCGVATNDHDVGSPSLPNYIGATSGRTWGIGDDNPPSSHPLAVDNLFRQVRATGRSERSYLEAMPGPCALRAKGRYAVKHNPAAYYVGADDRAACGHDDLPLDGPTAALATAIDRGRLPSFALVVPDLCHDTHDCSVAQGDLWLSEWVPRLLSGPNYRAGRTLVFVAWDEPSPMALFVLAPSVRPGTVVTARTDHYGLLRTTEEALRLPLLGGATTAVPLQGLFGL